MKKIAGFLLMVCIVLSFTACGDKDSSVSSSTFGVQTSSVANSANSTASVVAKSGGVSSGSVNPKANYSGKPAQKQQVNDTANDVTNTLNQIQSTINSLDSGSDVNTDNIQ